MKLENSKEKAIILVYPDNHPMGTGYIGYTTGGILYTGDTKKIITIDEPIPDYLNIIECSPDTIPSVPCNLIYVTAHLFMKACHGVLIEEIS